MQEKNRTIEIVQKNLKNPNNFLLRCWLLVKLYAMVVIQELLGHESILSILYEIFLFYDCDNLYCFVDDYP